MYVVVPTLPARVRCRFFKGIYSEYVYCAISINSAGLVTRYTPAEFLISAPHKNARYIRFFFGR